MEPEQNNTPIVNGKPVMPHATSVGRRGQPGGKRRLALIGASVLAVALIIGVSAWLWFARDGIDTEMPVARVAISAAGFSPATIQVKEGQDIAWVNEDDAAHEVFALQEDVPGLDSTELLATGDTYIYTFEKAGTFNYYDPLNAKTHKGTVIVEK
jgi:plastocyanin